MSGHRRVKNLDYDDDDFEDDYDDYEGGEEPSQAQGDDGMTDEDREQLAAGTVKVRGALGDSPNVSDFDIQEALWHYWFDVDKTVVYLKKDKDQPRQQAKQQKAVSKFDQAAAASAEKADSTLASTDMAFAKSSSLFDGVSWSSTPPAETTTFTPTVVRPRPCLLGGSGKPSKLAALAAARKAKEAAAAASNGSSEQPQSSNAISLLDRLGSKDVSSKPSTPSLPVRARPPTKAVATEQSTGETKAATEPSAGNSDSSTTQPMEVETCTPTTTRPRDQVNDGEAERPQKRLRYEDVRAKPSAFARSLCVPSTRKPRESHLSQEELSKRMTEYLFGDVSRLQHDGFSGPSPDTIVMQAQAKGKAQPPAKKSNGAAKVTKAVDGLSLDDVQEPVKERPRVATKVQSKNLNVVEEYNKSKGKKESNFVVVGHIDHGKSTLMGRLLYDHKVVDKRSLDKFRKEAAKIGKESFALAWVMDAREDEREHGVTIDYAEKTFETDKAVFTIIDAPGHRDFVGNMIAGTSMADFALMVIDAGTNSFEAGLKGQTREHAQVVRCMKLERLVVAVNKMDAVSWSQEAFEAVRHKAASILEEMLFKPADIIFVPCSGLTGDNITTRPTFGNAKWYQGPTLIQSLEDLDSNRSQYLGSLTDPFRLRIAAFAGLSEHTEFAGANAHEPFTALGRIDAGTVQIGDVLLGQPGGETCVVKGVTRHGKPADWAVAGQIVGLQLTDCDEERLAKGDVLCSSSSASKPVTSVTMKILAFDTVFPMPVDVHRGRLRVQGRITELYSTLDMKTHQVLKEAPKVVKHGSVARVRVDFDQPVALERPTRVVLRYGGETIAAGAVEKGE